MAGKFRGDVAKLSKPPKSRSSLKGKAKKTVSLVKRSPKLRDDALKNRIAELMGGGVAISHTSAILGTQKKKQVGRAAIEIIGKRKENYVPEEELAQQRTTAEAIGLKILHQAVKNQSHNRLLSHQNRHDYEYRLRSVATMGVVQLFNSLAQARKASTALEAETAHLTADKAHEKKQVVSKEAFLAALRQSREIQQF